MKLVVICAVMSMAIARPQADLDALAAHQAAVDKILIAQGRAPGSIGGAHEVAILRHQQAEAELIALAEAEAAKAATSPARSVKIDIILAGVEYERISWLRDLLLSMGFCLGCHTTRRKVQRQKKITQPGNSLVKGHSIPFSFKLSVLD